MKKIFVTLFILFGSYNAQAQYTDIINSNQPGNSMSAYSVGTNVLQLEGGFWFEQRNHSKLFIDKSLFGFNYAVRYGAFSENLEFVGTGSMVYDYTVFNKFIPIRTKRFGFYNHTIGVKYLLYNYYREDRTNLYSWKANHRFNWKNMIPSVALYLGANVFPNKKYFYEEIGKVSPRAVISLQSHPQPHTVFVVNFIADYITEKYPTWSYITTMTHNIDDGRFSIFLENEGVQSEFYSDMIFRAGGAYLFITDLQVNLELGIGVKDTPHRYMALMGISYRFDKHNGR